MPFRDTFVCPGHPLPHPSYLKTTHQDSLSPGELRRLFTVLGCTKASSVLLLPCTEGRGDVGVVSTCWLIAQLCGQSAKLPPRVPPWGWGDAGLHLWKRAVFRLPGVLQSCSPYGFEYLSVALNPCQ